MNSSNWFFFDETTVVSSEDQLGTDTHQSLSTESQSGVRPDALA